jgi:hypothetical protein
MVKKVLQRVNERRTPCFLFLHLWQGFRFLLRAAIERWLLPRTAGFVDEVLRYSPLGDTKFTIDENDAD